MNSSAISLAPLTRALQRLREGLARWQATPGDDQLRDGLIQRFEFCYELTHKMLKRYLESSSPSADLFDTMAFADLIRSGNEAGLLLGDWPVWRNFRDLRNLTSHTYNEKNAIAVVACIPDFIAQSTFLHDQLVQRIRAAKSGNL